MHFKFISLALLASIFAVPTNLPVALGAIKIEAFVGLIVTAVLGITHTYVPGNIELGVLIKAVIEASLGASSGYVPANVESKKIIDVVVNVALSVTKDKVPKNVDLKEKLETVIKLAIDASAHLPVDAKPVVGDKAEAVKAIVNEKTGAVAQP